MKKYLITPVLVCLFLVGCSSEDGSHNHSLLEHDHDHDHGLLDSHDVVLEEEVVSNKTLVERFELVKLGMTFEEVKFVMGFPDIITWEDFKVDPTRVGLNKLLVWEYSLDPDGEILFGKNPRGSYTKRINRLQVGFFHLNHDLMVLYRTEIVNQHGNKIE